MHPGGGVLKTAKQKSHKIFLRRLDDELIVAFGRRTPQMDHRIEGVTCAIPKHQIQAAGVEDEFFKGAVIYKLCNTHQQVLAQSDPSIVN